MPISYFEQLKANLTADANAKKAAYDAVFDAYTQAQFDASGNLSYKQTGKLGTRDVQYDTQKRATATGGEQSGMLRSGQQARAVATDLAAYKADVLGSAGQLAADKAAVDTGLTTSIAEAQAKYGTVPGAASSTSPTSTTTNSNKKEEITAPPVYAGTSVPVGTSSAAGFRAAEEATKKKTPATPSKTNAAPKTSVPAKKILPPKRIGGL